MTDAVAALTSLSQDVPIPIPTSDWHGLAGAMAFKDGSRPWFWRTSGNSYPHIVVCGGREGVEIHEHSEGEIECESWQLALDLNSALGLVITSAAVAAVIRYGAEHGAVMLGFEPN